MFIYTPHGVCSNEIHVNIDDKNKIENIQVIGGCPGSLIALSELCKGQDATAIIHKLRGISCGKRETSCPDQLSYALEAALQTDKADKTVNLAPEISKPKQMFAISTK